MSVCNKEIQNYIYKNKNGSANVLQVQMFALIFGVHFKSGAVFMPDFVKRIFV